MKYKCTECNHPDEDNRLQLIVKDGVTHKFYITVNGTLEHYDSDGDGQEIFLECPVCGQTYEFEEDNCLVLQESYVLNKYNDNCYDGKLVDLNKLDFKKCQ